MQPEVVVVGGGPAGSACALELARAGTAVTLVERARFPRRKVCGEYLNGGSVAALERLGLGDAVRSAGAPLRGLRLVTPHCAPLELPFPGAALALERATLDALLLDAAVAAGVRVVSGRVEDLLHADGRVSGAAVRLPSGEMERLPARFVVGADGVGSVVARKLGLVKHLRGPKRFAVGGHYRGLGDLDGHVEMYVGGGAYFALNPLGDDRANVMVVVREQRLGQWSHAVDEGMRGAAAELGRGHRSFEGAERIGPRVSVGPLAFDVRAVTAPGAVLVGDAAGFLNPFSGQGVFLALRSAAAASDALLAALAQPASEAAALAGYARRRSSDLAARRRLARAVDLLVDVPALARRATARLRRFPELGEGLIGAMAGTLDPRGALAPLALARLIL